MKQINYFLCIFLFISLISCNKSEEVQKQSIVDPLTPEMKQRAFMGEVTSTTCGICGSSGYDNFNLMKKNNSGKIVALAFHCNYPSDSMQSSNLLFSYEGSRPTGGGIPAFYIGDYKTALYGMQPYIDTLLRKSPEAQLKFKTTIIGDSMKVTSKIKFFKNVTGDYYVSFFLCESGIDGGTNAVVGYKQTSGSADYKHNNVVRGGGTTSAYGVKISKAATTAINTVFDYSCSIKIASNWKRTNLFVTAVIWKKNPDNLATCQYLFVNGWDSQVYN